MGMDGFVWFFGKVVDRFDPLCLGRVKVRIFGLHPDETTTADNLVKNEDLPWAMPIQPITSAAIFSIGNSPVGPIEGTNVFGFFADGKDCQIPFVLGTVSTGIGHIAYNVVSNVEESIKKVSAAVAPVQTLGQLSKSLPVKAGTLGLRLMQELNLTDYQAAGILGNLAHESAGIQCDLRELGKNGGNGPCWPKGTLRKGYGWAQWTGSRMNEFIDFVMKNYNIDIQKTAATDDQNYAFLIYELKGVQRASIRAIKKTSNLRDATSEFMRVFEVPNAQYAHLDRRLNHAAQALASMNAVGPPIRSTAKNITNEN